METTKVDVAIIGAGTAGLNARREAERAGKSYVLIEGGPLGTTCARVGCMPSKLLIAAANAAHGVAKAEMFGIELRDGFTVDGRAVMARVKAERDRFAGFVVASNEELPPGHLLRGWAHFEGPGRLSVGSARVEATAVVVATGSSPWIPPILSEVKDDILTNEGLFDLDDLPASVAVFGSGVIGTELGQALARLGVDVHIFNPFSDLAGLKDPAVLEVAVDVLSQEMSLHLQTEVTRVHRTDAGLFRVTWETPSGPVSRDFAQVLSAAGRRPNVAGLKLEAAGVRLNERGGLLGWDPHTMQLDALAVFVAGDANDYRALLHEASIEGRIAGFNAANFPEVQSPQRDCPFGIGFTAPNVAFAGRRYDELDPEQHIIGEVSFDNQGRSRVMGVNRGLLRLYANRDCVLVGMELMAPAGEHLAHTLAWAINERTRVQELVRRPYYHPVIEEGLRTGLRDVAMKLRVASRCPPEAFAYTPG